MNKDVPTFSDLFQAIQVHGWWVVLVEMALIGAFVYAVLRFLRGTRGARMLKGIGLVLLVLYLIVRLVAQQYHLERLAYLYEQFLKFTGLVVIVVFQPELRRALMRLGETRLFRSFSHESTDEVDALVESAAFLSRRKIGAVMAIERNGGLGGIAEGGTRINADLSAALLNTIFWPNSPLHDLGVIISAGKIAYAGVQFPLTESGELDRELGSRHRAAVGMSQETNAVVLVVSEETGDISIADRGKLIRKLTPDALRRLLSELLGQTDDSAGNGKPRKPVEKAAA